MRVNLTWFSELNYLRVSLILGAQVVLELLILIKGVKSSGKVVWVTVTLPFVLIIILFWRVIWLEGAGDGIE